MTWKEYYDKFYDWEPSVAQQRLAQLETLGPSDEVVELAHELNDPNHLILKAIKQKVNFDGDEVVELLSFIEGDVNTQLFHAYKHKLSIDDIDLYAPKEDAYFSNYDLIADKIIKSKDFDLEEIIQTDDSRFVSEVLKKIPLTITNQEIIYRNIDELIKTDAILLSNRFKNERPKAKVLPELAAEIEYNLMTPRQQKRFLKKKEKEVYDKTTLLDDYLLLDAALVSQEKSDKKE